MRSASCRRQLQGEELCLHMASRQQGKCWAALPAGSSRSDFRNPLQKLPDVGGQRRTPGEDAAAALLL